MVAAAYEAEVALVELIIVVEQHAQRHHALALAVVDLDVEAELGDAAHGAVELLSDAVGHELYLLVLDAGTLG